MSQKILSNGKRPWTYAKDRVVVETSALMVLRGSTSLPAPSELF